MIGKFEVSRQIYSGDADRPQYMYPMEPPMVRLGIHNLRVGIHVLSHL